METVEGTEDGGREAYRSKGQADLVATVEDNEGMEEGEEIDEHGSSQATTVPRAIHTAVSVSENPSSRLEAEATDTGTHNSAIPDQGVQVNAAEPLLGAAGPLAHKFPEASLSPELAGTGGHAESTPGATQLGSGVLTSMHEQVMAAFLNQKASSCWRNSAAGVVGSGKRRQTLAQELEEEVYIKKEGIEEARLLHERFDKQDEDISIFARIHPSPIPIPTGPRNSETNSHPPRHHQKQRSAPRGPRFAPSQGPSSTQRTPRRHNDFSYPHFPEIFPRHLAGYPEPLQTLFGVR
ncbi:hypothetical protein P7C70_g8911, partial [Phenoliferia sp. Uapishka_3]